MGLFKDLFKPKRSTLPTDEEIDKIVMQKQFDKLKKETERLQNENREWKNNFDNIISLRQKAQQYEKENKINDAIETYLQSIDFGEKNTKLSINNYAHDIERVIILYSKLKQTNLLIDFLNYNLEKYPDYQDARKWAVRLSKLTNQNRIPVSLTPNDINRQTASSPTLGKKIDDFKKNMPEFNFYFDLPENMNSISYNNRVPIESFKKLKEYNDAFETIKSMAKIAENEGDYKKAIEAYEKMIIEEYEGAEPYERLMIIYSKLKWKNKEIETIKKAIAFFENLKKRQLKYVLSLAEKYNMTAKAKEYIDNDKKIFYYGGAFELYNPQVTRLKKWADRLVKIEIK